MQIEHGTVDAATYDSVSIARRPASPWRLALRRLRRNHLAMAGLAVLVVMILACLFGPMLSPYQTEKINIMNGNKPPSDAHWLGTDKLGRDILKRVLLAGRISLSVGIVAMVISVVIGSVLGAVAGFYGGLVDSLIMRLTDIMMSVPSLPLLIILGAVLSDLRVPPEMRIYIVMLILGVLSWPSLARLVRSEILTLREQEFMQAAEVLGLRDHRRIFRHLLPNTIPTIIVVATLTVAGAVLSEAVLSYFGIGVVPPTPSWGNLIQSANNLIDFQKRPWLWIPPGLCIFITVIAINMFGDGLRDALDPKMKR
ncbi:oligopeptide ABC transporter permease [Paenibacillus sp. GCM10023252]|uniref:oligopeptide ABC transporter permease n=1 Tax=Paenibacillus sp. GCM10023252 TaxID=3252649 RepID=UPI0036209984